MTDTAAADLDALFRAWLRRRLAGGDDRNARERLRRAAAPEASGGLALGRQYLILCLLAVPPPRRGSRNRWLLAAPARRIAEEWRWPETARPASGWPEALQGIADMALPFPGADGWPPFAAAPASLPSGWLTAGVPDPDCVVEFDIRLPPPL